MEDKPIYAKSTFWITLVSMLCATVVLYVGKIDSAIWLTMMLGANTGYLGKEAYTKKQLAKGGTP